MPTTRRRRLASSLLVSFASLLLLAGCVGQRDPDSWGDSTKESFVEACDGTAAKDEPVDEIRSDLEDAALPTEDCECIVDHLEENMEFSEFKDANSKRREDEDGAAPLTGGGFDEAYEACGVGEASAEPSDDDADVDSDTDGSEDESDPSDEADTGSADDADD